MYTRRDGPRAPVAQLDRAAFIDLDEAQQQEVREIMAGHTGIVQPGEDRVNADPFVIAPARCRGLVVVSGERRSGNPNTPKIPNVRVARCSLRESTGS